MNLEFDYQGKHYEVEINNPYYLPASYHYPSEFDYSIGRVYIDGEEVKGEWSPEADLEEHISDLVYDQLMEEK